MIMAINVEQTKKYYKDIKQEDLCDCNYCKNYYLQVKDAYPKVAEFLDSIGIDIEKPLETSPLEPDEHGMQEYCICQYIVIGSAPSELSKEIENVNEMIDKRIDSLNDHNMLIISGNKLFDSFINMKLEQLKLNNIKPAIIVSIQDISFIEDEHLNILINYLFDIAIDCMENNELEVKITEDQCAFEITLYMNDAKERINQMKYDTLVLILHKYHGSLQVQHAGASLYISTLIPVS